MACMMAPRAFLLNYRSLNVFYSGNKQSRGLASYQLRYPNPNGRSIVLVKALRAGEKLF